jgi:hypothetical protein
VKANATLDAAASDPKIGCTARHAARLYPVREAFRQTPADRSTGSAAAKMRGLLDATY